MTSELKIGLIGAGAVGSLLASALMHNRVEAHWVVRNPARRQHLRHLTLALPDRRLELDCSRLKIVGDIAELPTDLAWLILAVKAHQVDEVLAAGAPLAAENTLVVANGLHAFNAHLGLLYGGARLAEGALEACAENQLVMGILGASEDRAPQVVGPLTAPWLTAGCKEEIAVRMWHKLALNCVVNPLTALLDCPNGDLPLSRESRLIGGLLNEIGAVAKAELGERWGYETEHLRAALVQLVAATADNSSSMREDLRQGRETEISKLNLAVAAAGQQYGRPCPLNSRLGDMIFLITNNLNL
jgi:2-dehydropantoate 2-reductase